MPHVQAQTCARIVDQHAVLAGCSRHHARVRYSSVHLRRGCAHTGNPAQSRCTNQRLYAAQHGLTAVPEQYTGELEAAYLAGCKAGYAEGVQVTVNVSLDGETGVPKVQKFTDIQKDSLLRSLLKGLVWRVFSTALTVSIILVVFHDTVQVEQALQIGGLEFVLKLVVYFLHERLWVQIGDSIS